MADIFIRDVDDSLVERVRKLAEMNRRSLEQELRAIIAAAAPVRLTTEEKLALIDRAHALSPKQTTLAEDLIREDRDSR